MNGVTEQADLMGCLCLTGQRVNPGVNATRSGSVHTSPPSKRHLVISVCLDGLSQFTGEHSVH